MGSAEAPLAFISREMLANDWEVVGQFMYDRTAPGQLASARRRRPARSELKIAVTTFSAGRFKRAVEAAGPDAEPRPHRPWCRNVTNAMTAQSRRYGARLC